MQQFRASTFYTVVHWHKLDEVGNENIWHNSTVLAIRTPKISKFGEDLTKFWQKKSWVIFWLTLYSALLISKKKLWIKITAPIHTNLVETTSLPKLETRNTTILL